MPPYSIRIISESPTAFLKRPKLQSYSIRIVSELPRACREHPRVLSYSIRNVSEPPKHSQRVPEYRRTAFGLSQSHPGKSQSVPKCRRTTFGMSQSFRVHPQSSQNAFLRHSECLRASQSTPGDCVCDCIYVEAFGKMNKIRTRKRSHDVVHFCEIVSSPTVSCDIQIVQE